MARGPLDMAKALMRAWDGFELFAWTAFALGGPLTFLAMRNVLGVTITGAIGVLIGLVAFAPSRTQLRGRRALRVALVAQGLGLGAYGGLVLLRPAAPWLHDAGNTRTSVVLDEATGNVHALEFGERGTRFFTRAGATGAWRSEPFPGTLASTLWLGPRGAFALAPEDRSDTLWVRDASAGGRFRARLGLGFPVTFAATDDSVLLAARGKLWRLVSPDSVPVEVPDLRVTTVCARRSSVLAVGSRESGERARAWLSQDGGRRFVELAGASLAADRCALSDDGWAWVAREGTFFGDLAVAAPGAPFEARSAPAPRIEALVVNPRDGREAWLGVWGAGVFRTVDGGVSWRSMGLEGFEVSALVVDFARKVAFAGAGSGVYELVF